jgi:hypothetical protein
VDISSKESAMFKKTGLLALIISAATVILPSAAFAQNAYYRDGGYNYYGDRHEQREWKERERERRRAEERERRWREHARREHERQERERREYRFDRNY